jgi:hypothetical protein
MNGAAMMVKNGSMRAVYSFNGVSPPKAKDRIPGRFNDDTSENKPKQVKNMA